MLTEAHGYSSIAAPPASTVVRPMMEAPRIEGVRAEPVSVPKVATVVAAPTPVPDLLDRASAFNGGAQPRRGAESRGLCAIRDQRAGRERGYGDVNEKKFSHRCPPG